MKIRNEDVWWVFFLVIYNKFYVGIQIQYVYVLCILKYMEIDRVFIK